MFAARWLVAVAIMPMAGFFSAGAEAAGSAMLVGMRASAPAAFQGFCSRHPAECAPRNASSRPVVMNEKRWAELRAVNAEVNSSIREQTDYQIHGMADVWSLPKAGGAGDCEDFALLKRSKLLKMGWPSSSLLVTVVRDHAGAGHAVLTVTTNEGDFVLDNRAGSIRPWAATGYTYYTRQSASNPRVWVAVDRYAETLNQRKQIQMRTAGASRHRVALPGTASAPRSAVAGD